ncbi:MAG: hypothetical protein Kow0070_23120 [Anaerolineales bacterium]
MDKPSNNFRSFWLTILLFNIVVHLTMFRATYLRLVELGANLARAAWSGVLVLCLFIAALSLWLMIRIVTNRSNFVERAERITHHSPLLRLFGGILFIGILFIIPYVKFTYRIGQDVKQPVYDSELLLWLYYWGCWWLILLGMAAIRTASRTSWMGGFAASLLLLGLTYEVMTRYNVVTTYPFSLGWSEGSRYYYASLLFSRTLYGEFFPLSPYHASRYILQSIPFLFQGLGIFEHRLWQFLLWIGLTGGASLALAFRVIAAEKKWLRLLLAAWFFLFFMQIGVYYHLQVMVILVLVGISNKHPWRSVMVIVAASLWAGISRVNWFPMPAIMAAAIYLLETPIEGNTFKSFRHFLLYVSRPAVWTVLGIVSALVSQAAYVFLSGNTANARAFTSSFTSDLLWYRLLPNDSFPLGIIPGILLVSSPLLVGLIVVAVRHWKRLHPFRWAALFLMIMGLFAGSMVVSVKIGGGGDLHNTDTYAVLLSIIAAYFIGDRIRSDAAEARDWGILMPPVIAVGVALPVLFLIPALTPYPVYHADMAQESRQQLLQAVNELKKNGPVLFISERQMITFGDVDVPLVPDYEVIILMEMAMSGNQAYLQRFYTDLKEHRFAAIIAGRQNLGIKTEGVFFEENNAWNSKISPYILCYYEPTREIETELRPIQVFTPRLNGDCSLP